MADIQRWEIEYVPRRSDREMCKNNEGDYVLFADHERAVAEAYAKGQEDMRDRVMDYQNAAPGCLFHDNDLPVKPLPPPPAGESEVRA